MKYGYLLAIAKIIATINNQATLSQLILIKRELDIVDVLGLLFPKFVLQLPRITQTYTSFPLHYNLTCERKYDRIICYYNTTYPNQRNNDFFFQMSVQLN